ncbi:Uu.00g105050.m01.CDS01 [Anthostomella pinea]|uniref:Uu.00g105050.m01.CDS01 n=1 Tax=Anthostomella pinea TaxID=933095 RepID=A0AAI8VDQ4_9PEZI|nr:Uu.00g105050.m01.CDS01 [Anthostomella pinea]
MADDTRKTSHSRIYDGAPYLLPSTFSPWRSDDQIDEDYDDGESSDSSNTTISAIGAMKMFEAGTSRIGDAVSPTSVKRVSEVVHTAGPVKIVSPLSPPAHRSWTTPQVIVSAPSNTSLPMMPASSAAPPAPRQTKFREMLKRSLTPRREKGGVADDARDAPDPRPHSRAESYPMTSVDTLQPSTDDRSSEEEDNDDLSIRYAQPPVDCHSRRDVHIKRWSWLYVTLMISSIYSTGLSGVWLVTSIYQPRYGQGISSGAHWQLAPSTATLLCTLAAKTIELSFVTVFVAVLGQVITRRAFIKKSRGVTLAELTMRNWVIQPGSMITNWENIPHGATSVMGVLTLIATLCALFYTTASDAMVSPKLKWGSWDSQELQGLVRASYANPYFISDTCKTPIDTKLDLPYSAESCLGVQYSGQSYHNLIAFMTEWEAIHSNGNSTMDEISKRPTGKHSLFDNTTLESSWIEAEYSDPAANFAAHDRVINNVTLAMPHPGVYAAATDSKNGILQPNDLNGVGEYSILASVVSPTVNVMCVNMNADELAPLVYTTWPDARNDDTEIPGQQRGADDWYEDVPVVADTEWLNGTAVDDVFRWGEKYGRRPPVFQLYPIDYNMIANATVYMGDAIYLLSKANTTATDDYSLCELRSWVTPKCSTHFDISGISGGKMKAHCEDASDPDSYALTDPSAAQSPLEASGDWKNVAQLWALSINLNAGTENSNASNARILTDLILNSPRLDPLLPSMAEALAVLASSSIVSGSLQTTYRAKWPHGDVMQLDPGVYETFRAHVRTQQYASAHSAGWQGVFYPVLAGVFLLNVLCLAYLASGGGGCCFTGGSRGSSRNHNNNNRNGLKGNHHPLGGERHQTTNADDSRAGGLVTDYTEPQKLFALAINSPPSRALAGSCGHGPDALEMVVPFRVGYASGSNHYFFEEAADRFAGKNNGLNVEGGFGNNVDVEGGYNGRRTGRRNRMPSSQTFNSGTELLADGTYRSSYKRLSSSRTWL